MLKQYSKHGSEQARQAATQIFSLQNSQKAFKGELTGPSQIRRPMDKKRGKRTSSVRSLMSNAQWKEQFGRAWDDDCNMPNTSTHPRSEYRVFAALDSQLAELAETDRPSMSLKSRNLRGERLPGYQEAQLDSLRLRLFSPAPIYPEFEKARLARKSSH